MAITNNELMLAYRMEHGIPESVELYTFGAWKAKGYKVKKGEKAAHKVPLWKHVDKVKEQDGEEVKTGFCVTRTMSLFTREQVEPIQKEVK